MCIFSGEVESVSKTNIFARSQRGRQVLVYSMSMSALDEVAMILPIPVASDDEDAVEFLSLEHYPEFFEHMARPWAMKSKSLGDTFGDMRSRDTLKIHKVGCFDASYVPTVNDFDRLDKRFRIPHAAAEHPPYRKYGFVVFQLRAGEHDVHPMAFSFLTALPQLFFPTVHVHDGSHMHKREEFDHSLYAQTGHATDWQTSHDAAGHFMDADKCNKLFPIVDMGLPYFRRVINGMGDNSDVLL